MYVLERARDFCVSNCLRANSFLAFYATPAGHFVSALPATCPLQQCHCGSWKPCSLLQAVTS
jgi:hypothetical protein